MAVAEWTPLVDISGDDPECLIKAELPEIKKEDVKAMAKRRTKWFASIPINSAALPLPPKRCSPPACPRASPDRFGARNASAFQLPAHPFVNRILIRMLHAGAIAAAVLQGLWRRLDALFRSKAETRRLALARFEALKRQQIEIERLDRLRNPGDYRGR